MSGIGIAGQQRYLSFLFSYPILYSSCSMSQSSVSAVAVCPMLAPQHISINNSVNSTNFAQTLSRWISNKICQSTLQLCTVHMIASFLDQKIFLQSSYKTLIESVQIRQREGSLIQTAINSIIYHMAMLSHKALLLHQM